MTRRQRRKISTQSEVYNLKIFMDCRLPSDFISLILFQDAWFTCWSENLLNVESLLCSPGDGGLKGISVQVSQTLQLTLG